MGKVSKKMGKGRKVKKKERKKVRVHGG